MTDRITRGAVPGRRRKRRICVLRGIVVACLWLAPLLSACGDDDHRFYDQCRFDPAGCRGGLGGFCRGNADCGIGFCCRDPKECGGGMCTFECRSDRDCPVDMGCEHDVCFFLCNSDYDCARGQDCGHGRTVCEW
jgi:hypothetical protein